MEGLASECHPSGTIRPILPFDMWTPNPVQDLMSPSILLQAICIYTVYGGCISIKVSWYRHMASQLFETASRSRASNFNLYDMNIATKPSFPVGRTTSSSPSNPIIPTISKVYISSSPPSWKRSIRNMKEADRLVRLALSVEQAHPMHSPNFTLYPVQKKDGCLI